MGFKSLWRTLTMGNNQSNMQTIPSAPKDEPLDCIIKEHKRDEHLKNLGMKRNKSIRKSIAKKLRRKDKLKEEVDANSLNNEEGNNKENSSQQHQQPQQQPLRDFNSRSTTTSSSSRNSSEKPQYNSKPSAASSSSSAATTQVHIETRTSIGSQIDGGKRVEVIRVEGRKSSQALVGETLPLPAHLQGEGPRKMDKLRRSIRHSIKKRKESGVELTKQEKWKIDEAGVRAGTCQFYVKYLGACEVYESRGMQVCEAAVQTLKEQKRRTIRGTLYVSGDSIRLVDDDTKGLVLDQTIEKVSFCAPDRNFDRGFSYVCRDGTTRRWMCHAFMAVGDNGDRLSHAVGCAFGICLENKQKRDKTNVSVAYDAHESSFTRNGSFAVRTLAERLADPQASKPGVNHNQLETMMIRSSRTTDSPKSMRSMVSSESESSASATNIAVDRPRPPELMYARQASFRGLGQLAGNTPFKRNSRGQLSLRVNDLPSTKERRVGGGSCDRSLLRDSPILEDIELPSSNLEANGSSQQRTNLDLLCGDDAFILGGGSEYPGSLVSGGSGTSTPGQVARQLTGGAEPGSEFGSSSYNSLSPPTSLLIPVKLHKQNSSSSGGGEEEVVTGGKGGGGGGSTPHSDISNPWDKVPGLANHRKGPTHPPAGMTTSLSSDLTSSSVARGFGGGDSYHLGLGSTSLGNIGGTTAGGLLAANTGLSSLLDNSHGSGIIPTVTSISNTHHNYHNNNLWAGSSSSGVGNVSTPGGNVYNFDFHGGKMSVSSTLSSFSGTAGSTTPLDIDNGLLSTVANSSNGQQQQQQQQQGTSSGFNSPASSNSGTSLHNGGNNNNSNMATVGHDFWQQAAGQSSILEDPFDAEWAAIASRNSTILDRSSTTLTNSSSLDLNTLTTLTTSSSTNPFLEDANQLKDANQMKAFELQL